ncbi:MAG: hypothetical protein MK212_08995, partial [Saprospiraceae bacterium]|nr:hypothetical protein [Saprospiraceae bacterium]
MNSFLKNLGCLLLLLCALGINTQTTSAQVSANCHSTAYVNLDANGTGMITINDINNGSVGTILGIFSGNAPNVSISQIIPVDCNDLGSMPVILTVADSAAGVTHVCTTNVIISDTLGTCSTNSGLILTDSFSTDASNCNTCDGEAYVFLEDPNNPSAIASSTPPYLFQWSDGVNYTAAQYAFHDRNDLCAGTYTVTMYDATQASYTYTLQIGCGSNNGCIDPNQI